MQRSILIIFSLLLPFNGLAQHYWKASERFSEIHGLSNNATTHFVKDKKGFVWIATTIGLNRFDGKKFKIFTKNYSDRNSLLSNTVATVSVDSKNRIWIGYYFGGISCYDQTTDKFRHFEPDSTKKNALPHGIIDNLFIDSKERVWIGVAFEGLFMYDPATDIIQNLGPLPHTDKSKPISWQRHFNRISEIEEDHYGTLWMATGDGLYSLNPETMDFKVYRYENDPAILNPVKKDVFNTICHTDSNGFFLGGWGSGLNYFDRHTQKWTHYSINKGVHNIIGTIRKKSDHEIWVTSVDTTLCIFNTRTKSFDYIAVETLSEAQLNFKTIRTIYCDDEENLWVGHQNGFNILNLSKPELEYIKLPVTYSTNGVRYTVSSIFEDPVSQCTFISTEWCDGLNVIEPDGTQRNYEVDQTNNVRGPQFVNILLNDSKNRLWVPTYVGIYQFDRRLKKLNPIPLPVPDTSTKGIPNYWKMEESADGKLWIPTSRHGIYIMNPDNFTYEQLFHQPGNTHSLRGNTITGLELTKSGLIWIGYDKRGLSLYNPKTKKFTHFTKIHGDNKSLLDNQIVSLFYSKSEDELWVGTLDGICRIRIRNGKVSIENFVHGQDLLGTVVYEIRPDFNGNLWVVNSKGLTIFNPKTYEIRSYNHAVHNLQDMGFSSISMGKNGTMLLGSSAGYFRTNIDSGKVRITPKPVYFTDFHSGSASLNPYEAIEGKNAISLAAEQNFFTIEFVSINYRQLGNVQYTYRLKGAEEDWKPLTFDGVASYAQLPGGEYIFEVKATNDTGEWSELSSLPIIIATPYYKKTWFNIAIALLAASSIFALYRFRIRTIEKAEALKTKLNKQLAETEMKALRAQMNPHFIFNGLNSINRYIIKNDHKTASLYLTKFAKLIRHILDNSEHQEIPLSQEIDTLKLYIDIEALRFDSMFTYKIEVDENIYTDSVMIPPMLIQPYVENAIWHGLLHKSTPGHMNIMFAQEPGILICSIADDGVGREKAAEMKSKSATTRKSLGLKITSDRIEMLGEKTGKNGSVNFEDLFHPDGSPAGTKVVVRIPIEDD